MDLGNAVYNQAWATIVEAMRKMPPQQRINILAALAEETNYLDGLAVGFDNIVLTVQLAVNTPVVEPPIPPTEADVK